MDKIKLDTQLYYYWNIPAIEYDDIYSIEENDIFEKYCRKNRIRLYKNEEL